MADFKQATKWLKEGKKVRRPEFDDEYISLFDGSIPKFINTNKENTKEYFTFDVIDFEATDWEIYEEIDDWCLNDCYYNHKVFLNCVNGYDVKHKYEGYLLDDIKILKEKILEDIKEESFSNDYGDDIVLLYDIKDILNKRFGF